MSTPVPRWPVLLLLLATGWAANHFAALLPVLRVQEDLSATLLTAVFGLYAVGLLPGLLGGGVLSDRVGRAAVAVPGAALATVGTLSLLEFHGPTGLVVGRLLVGLGAGATFSAGTAWAADLGGAAGATQAGVLMTVGFAGGPVVSGVLGAVAPAPLVLPFVVSALLSAVAVAASVVTARRARTLPAAPGTAGSPAQVDPDGPAEPGRSGRATLGWMLPVAPFVFTCGTVGLVTLPSRLPSSYAGPLLTGVAGGVVLGTGILVQAWARRRGVGPRAGTVGSLAAAAGLGLAALGGDHPSLPLVAVTFLALGLGYGLTLRAGLLDLERWAPAAQRGSLTGVFYVATYLGFGVPLLLEALRPVAGARVPLAVLAGLAVLAALARGVRLRRLALRDGEMATTLGARRSPT